MAQVLPGLASVLVVALTAYALGPGGRGTFAFVVSTAALVSAIGFGSLHVGAVQALRQGIRRAPGASVQLAFGSALLILALFSIGALVTRYTGAVGLYKPLSLIAIGVGAAAGTLTLALARFQQATGHSRFYRNVMALQAALYAGAVCPAAWLTRSPTATVGAWLTVQLCIVAYLLFCAPEHINYRRVGGKVRSVVLRTSISAHAAVLGQQLLYRADVPLLGFFVASKQLGAYSVAVPVIEMVWIVAEAECLALFSSSAGRPPPQVWVAARRAGFRYGRVAVFVAPATVAGIALAAHVDLRGYHAVVWIVAILAPGVVIQGLGRIALTAIIAAGDDRAARRVGAGSAILGVLYVPAIAAFGVPGAAVASTTIYIAQTAVARVAMRRRLSRVVSTVT